jgi:hypothetical protein
MHVNWDKRPYWNYMKNKKKGKANATTGRGGPHSFLDNQLTDDGKVVSPTRQPLFTPKEDSWYSFLLEAESTPGP